MAESGTSSRKVLARLREARAIELRVQGYSYPEIARELGYQTPGAAYRAVVRGLSRVYPEEEARQLLRLELARLDELLRVLWPKAVEGDLGAIDRVLRIIERRARLMGLDAPEKITLSQDALKWEEIAPWLLEEGRDNENAGSGS